MPHAMPACPDRSRLPRRSEDGFALIETIVSAMLVVLIAIGVYTGLDAASATSGTNKARSVASDLAQADQERMRAYRASDLSNLRGTRTQVMAGTTYTIVSRADWVTDSSGTASCAGAGALANFIKISSTVTWPNMKIKPVVLDSLVAPPNGSFNTDEGTLAVQIRDRNGNGVQGITVSLVGPDTFTDVTNENGCILAGYLVAGNYDVRFAVPGWVDRQGQTNINQTVGVVAEQTTTAAFDYDRAGSAALTFQTQPASAPVQAAQAPYASLAQSGLAAPGYRVWGSGTFQPSYNATGLFPFPSPYGAYSGNCSGADPQTYSQPRDTVSITPGGAASSVVWLPAVNLLVRRGGTPLPNARVRVSNITSGCSGVYTLTTSTAGNLRQPSSPVGSQDPGLPYGTYNVCADDGTRSVVRNGIANPARGGTAVLPMDIPTSGPTGTCP